MPETCNLARHSEQRFCCGGLDCHRAFCSISPFDWHRQDGVCVDPGTAVDKAGKPRFKAHLVTGADGSPLTIWGGTQPYKGPKKKTA